jgi:uncharacterized protein YbaR (Trm112 family)
MNKVCPICNSELSEQSYKGIGKVFTCSTCKKNYTLVDGVLTFYTKVLPEAKQEVVEKEVFEYKPKKQVKE